jgi:hypothetical protein
MNVTASRRVFAGIKKARAVDFPSEKCKTPAPRRLRKYFLDAKIFQSSGILRGKIILRAKK